MIKRLVCLALLAATVRLSAAAEDMPAVHFTIDAKRDVKPISRFIYGVNRTLDGPYARCTCSRVGGNRWTAYNWTNNASNAGSDWQFENDAFLGGGDAPGGAVASAIDTAQSRRAALLLTIPMAGYVAADKNGGGDVHKSGADYLTSRFRPSAARKGKPFTLKPDSNSAQVYQDEFVNWVKARAPAGFSGNDAPIWFNLDNEPDLWSSTHAEIHPAPASYAELLERTIDYAKAIKAVVPKTKIFGPSNYGWQGYVRLQSAPDAHDQDFQEWYLRGMAQAEKKQGTRLLDVLDVHWYPEATGGGQRIVSQESSPAIAAARMQAPRSLWDAGYTESSWITRDALHGPIRLIPRLQDKIDRNYPGTHLCFGEYNYGGGGISGAIAEADVLGIFGRTGVFAAFVWPLAGKEPFIAGGLKMFRDFDGKGGAFGDTSVSAVNESASDTSIYASLESEKKDRMVIVAINKTDHDLRAVITLVHAMRFTGGEIFQLTAASSDPRDGGKIRVEKGNQLNCTLPAESVTTIQLKP